MIDLVSSELIAITSEHPARGSCLRDRCREVPYQVKTGFINPTHWNLYLCEEHLLREAVMKERSLNWMDGIR